MKIRSITIGFTPDPARLGEQIRGLAGFVEVARQAYTTTGYEVQTLRLATTPFPTWLTDLRPERVLAAAQESETAARAAGFGYISLGPALPEYPESYAAIPTALAGTQDTFFGGVIARRGQGINLRAVQASAEIMRALSTHDPNGFGNLYFAALANVPAGAPFFPAAYHAGGSPAFAIACQAADLAVQAFQNAASLDEARAKFQTSLRQHAAILGSAAEQLSAQTGLRFNGLDLTPAPFPDAPNSIGAALEALGAAHFGAAGSLSAAAFLTSSLDGVPYLRAGFNGLMLPVLEDAVLAQRAAEGRLSLNDLLLYSAVCGTGLDTIPLPGDTPAAALAAVLTDLAALALRLNKPLTARLMPVPGKQAGDPTGFDFDFFANSKVLGLTADGLGKLWSSQEWVEIPERAPIP